MVSNLSIQQLETSSMSPSGEGYACVALAFCQCQPPRVSTFATDLEADVEVWTRGAKQNVDEIHSLHSTRYSPAMIPPW